MQHDDINRRILIIDDNRAIHQDFQKILDSERSQTTRLQSLKSELFKKDTANDRVATPFSISSAYQGQEGLEMVRECLTAGTPYALAFVDMRMPPGWDGLETIAQLWNVDPEIQIVISSAYSDYNWTEIVKKLGSTDNLLILKKPFDNLEVLQLAHALTQKWSLRRLTQASLESLEEKVAERTQELVAIKHSLEQEIEQRHQVEVELRLAQKLESIGHLAAGIAHEINTPTQFIGDNTRFLQDAFGDVQNLLDRVQQYLEAVKQGTTSEQLTAQLDRHLHDIDLPYLMTEIPRAIQDSLGGIKRVSEIVRAMKEFSHPGTKEKESTDINALIENTSIVCRNEWKYVAELHTDLDTNLPTIPCLPGEFGQVMLNMIINAAHAIGAAQADSGERGAITICTRQVDDTIVEVTIADTGEGIPEAIQSKIYDPFFTTKEVGKGTGQGLAIARSLIVEKLGGTIQFTTEQGKGTTFYLRLPTHELIDRRAKEQGATVS